MNSTLQLYISNLNAASESDLKHPADILKTWRLIEEAYQETDGEIGNDLAVLANQSKDLPVSQSSKLDQAKHYHRFCEIIGLDMEDSLLFESLPEFTSPSPSIESEEFHGIHTFYKEMAIRLKQYPTFEETVLYGRLGPDNYEENTYVNKKTSELESKSLDPLISKLPTIKSTFVDYYYYF